MSLKVFLSKVWRGISAFFHRIENAIKDNIGIAVNVVEALKAFIESPTGDLITSLIDDKLPFDLKQKLREWLPKVLTSLHIVNDCKDLEDEEMIQCVVEKIAALDEDGKRTLYHSLAILVAEKLSDGKLTFSESIALVEYYYVNFVNKQS